MRFGGHESFGVRDGWLYKGTEAISASPGQFFDESLADNLGVGRNMAKSIRFWMSALSLMNVSAGKGEERVPQLSRLAQVLRERDPYLVKQSTIWALHCTFLNDSDQAQIWKWFFNHFALRNFTKGECEDAATVYFATRAGGRPPTADSLARDLSCLLNMYSVEIPERIEDPEDNYASPFSRLGLLSHLKSAHFYRLNDSTKKIPANVFGYAVQLFANQTVSSGSIELSFKELLAAERSPGRMFVLSSEALLTLLTEVSREYPKVYKVVGHAGDRYLSVQVQEPLAWIENSFCAPESTEVSQ